MLAHQWHVYPWWVGGCHCTRERTACAIFYLWGGPTVRSVISTAWEIIASCTTMWASQMSSGAVTLCRASSQDQLDIPQRHWTARNSDLSLKVYINNINNKCRHLVCTLSQWPLHFLASFLAPPDMSSELWSASSTAVHIQPFQVLSAWLPAVCCFVRTQMSSAEFAALHLVCLGGLAGGFGFDCFMVGGFGWPLCRNFEFEWGGRGYILLVDKHRQVFNKLEAKWEEGKSPRRNMRGKRKCDNHCFEIG
jgi:hypothetical protein